MAELPQTKMQRRCRFSESVAGLIHVTIKLEFEWKIFWQDQAD